MMRDRRLLRLIASFETREELLRQEVSSSEATVQELRAAMAETRQQRCEVAGSEAQQVAAVEGHRERMQRRLLARERELDREFERACDVLQDRRAKWQAAVQSLTAMRRLQHRLEAQANLQRQACEQELTDSRGRWNTYREVS